jgi:hypothetical protein
MLFIDQRPKGTICQPMKKCIFEWNFQLATVKHPLTIELMRKTPIFVGSWPIRNSQLPQSAGDDELVALDDALERLTQIDERRGKIVQVKFFGGLTAPEIAQVLGISLATVERDWATARIWLRRDMSRADSP